MHHYLHIESIAQLQALMGQGALQHPLVWVMDLHHFRVEEDHRDLRITNAFYALSFKAKVIDAQSFGRSHYDFDSGILTATAPGQLFSVTPPLEQGSYQGWALFFDADLLVGSGLLEKLKSYGFFTYGPQEALHLSEKEQRALQTIVNQIAAESEEVGSEYNVEILTSSIELLLNYVKRYYSRQFTTRKVVSTGTVMKFNALLDNYFEARPEMPLQLPSVNQLAEQLHLSPGYLSDLLKKSTGKTAQELIHYQVIEKAKHLLLSVDAPVAEIAYRLGFDYPPYFSRIFRKKTGQTPLQYRHLRKPG